MTPWRFQLVPLEVVGGPQHSVDSHGRGASARIEENFLVKIAPQHKICLAWQFTFHAFTGKEENF